MDRLTMKIMAAIWLVVLAACDGGFALTPHDAGGTDADPCPSQVPAQIVYFAQERAIYQPGDLEDSSTNTSTIVRVTSDIGRWPHTVNEFNTFFESCRARLEPFNLTTTIQNPGDVNHIEIMMGSGMPALKFPQISAAIPHSCVRYRRPIGFIDAQVIGFDVDALCDAALRLIGLTTGLDLTADPTDVMSVSGSSGRTYADHDAACIGDFGLCPCTGEPTQNSFQRMIEAYGSRCPEQ